MHGRLAAERDLGVAAGPAAPWAKEMGFIFRWFESDPPSGAFRHCNASSSSDILDGYLAVATTNALEAAALCKPQGSD
jgi:hypothetical protein